VSWSEDIKFTDRPVGRRIGVGYGNADIRQPPGLVALDPFSLVAWDDTRNGDPATQTQDVYSAAVQYDPIGGDVSRTVLFWLSVAAGLALFGVVLFVVLRALGRIPAEADERVPYRRSQRRLTSFRRALSPSRRRRPPRGRVGIGPRAHARADTPRAHDRLPRPFHREHAGLGEGRAVHPARDRLQLWGSSTASLPSRPRAHPERRHLPTLLFDTRDSANVPSTSPAMTHIDREDEAGPVGPAGADLTDEVVVG
jgi:hypothetical protein